MLLFEILSGVYMHPQELLNALFKARASISDALRDSFIFRLFQSILLFISIMSKLYIRLDHHAFSVIFFEAHYICLSVVIDMIHLGFHDFNFSLKDYEHSQTFLIFSDDGLSGGIDLNLFAIVQQTLCMPVQPSIHIWNSIKEHYILREFTTVVSFQDSLVAISSYRCKETVS